MYEILAMGSSSKGNCIYVDTGDCRFLLDVGLSFKNIKKQLQAINVKLSSIDYILITHEHIDHIRSLEKILSIYNMGVIVSRGTLQSITIPQEKVLYIKDGDQNVYQNITVEAKRVNHDANEPLCFSIINSMGEKLLYLTDCGLAKYLKFKNHDVYIVEANYCKEILEKNFSNNKIHRVRYKRALSGMGHLSIEETIEFLSKNIGKNTEQIILSHLSSDNANKNAFKQMVIDNLFFFNVYIAEEGLDVKCGKNPQPF